MNVDWDWVKQRPHFIAEHLSRLNDVMVIYPYDLYLHGRKRGYLPKNERSEVRLYPFLRLPFGRWSSLIRKINVFALRTLAKLLLNRLRPDIVWISSPQLFEYLPKNLSSKLVYDCMDDVLAFPRNALHIDLWAANEKELIRASSHVTCSSANLRDKLIARYGHSEKYSVVHNALEPSAFSSAPVSGVTEKKEGRYVLGYVGTISSWMDLKALTRIVDAFASVEIHLIGPIENLGAQQLRHDRIKFFLPVRHGDLLTRISGFDALLMPFKVTELIQSVDPVKLYEYIFFNKPIISVRYQEIERFANFVDFYTNHEELISIINKYSASGFNKKYSDNDRLQFISSNTWSDRVNRIGEILDTLR